MCQGLCASLPAAEFDKLPSLLKSLLKKVYEKTEEKYPGYGYVGVAGFFVIRMLSPAIIYPEKFQTCKKRVSSQGRRSLISFAKGLQQISLGQKLPEDRPLSCVNDLVDSQFTMFQDLMKTIFEKDSGCSMDTPRGFKQKVGVRVLIGWCGDYGNEYLFEKVRMKESIVIVESDVFLRDTTKNFSSTQSKTLKREQLLVSFIEDRWLLVATK